MEPIQVALSENLKKHKAVRVSFYNGGTVHEEREASLRKTSPSLTRTNSPS